MHYFAWIIEHLTEVSGFFNVDNWMTIKNGRDHNANPGLGSIDIQNWMQNLSDFSRSKLREGGLHLMFEKWSYYRMTKIRSTESPSRNTSATSKASGKNLNYVTLAPQTRQAGPRDFELFAKLLVWHPKVRSLINMVCLNSKC